MEPTAIVDRGEILLVGLSFYGDPFTEAGGWSEGNEIGRLWKRFMAFLGAEHQRIKGVREEDVAYEVHVYDEQSDRIGQWEIFVGMEVERLEDVPVELVVKILPPAKYAIFTFQGEQIAGDWHTPIFAEWMPRAGYREAYSYSFQRYDERYKGVDKLVESELDVYIPIVREGGKST